MSAIAKASAVFGGLALAGVATNFSMKQTGDFSKQALNAAEHGANEVVAAAKPKLPSNFFQFTMGEKTLFSNARA